MSATLAPLPRAARPLIYDGRRIRLTHEERRIAAQWVRAWRKGGPLSLKEARRRLFYRFN